MTLCGDGTCILRKKGCDPDDPQFTHDLQPRICAHDRLRLGEPIEVPEGRKRKSLEIMSHHSRAVVTLLRAHLSSLKHLRKSMGQLNSKVKTLGVVSQIVAHCLFFVLILPSSGLNNKTGQTGTNGKNQDR